MSVKRFGKVIMALLVFGLAVLPATAEEEATEGSDQMLTVVRDLYPAWSPDSKKIAFYSNRTSFSDTNDEQYQIFVIDVATREVSQLTHDTNANRNPNWSPDGRRMLYSVEANGKTDIWIMDADGMNQRNLTPDDANDYHPKWLTNTTFIFDSDKDHSPENRITNREIYTMDLESGAVTRITDYPDWDTFASRSPDGTKLTWRRIMENPDGSRNAEVVVMNVDGTNLVRLTNDPAFDAYPTWSADGSKIMFSSNSGADHYEDFDIYLINPDGTGRQKITETIHNVEQIRGCFSPDGSFIAYNRQHLDGRIEIHIMSAPESN